MFETPILFLVFNRLDTTKQVFERIKQIRPICLYIAADGARESKEGEDKDCQIVREYIMNNIDWECEIKTLFRENNLGCRVAVSSAIDWFFDNVEQGIILEDDILPDLSFFVFCEQALKTYRNDDKVMHISGFNIAPYLSKANESHFFSYFGSVWGWATWRRAWKHYDVDLKNLEKDKNNVLEHFPKSLRKERYDLYLQLFQNKIDTWDLQWTFSRLSKNAVSIIAKNNLIENIGFGIDATHTLQKPNWADRKIQPLEMKITRSTTIKVNKVYDKIHLNYANSTNNFKKYNMIGFLKGFYKRVLRNTITISEQKETVTLQNNEITCRNELVRNINFIGSKKPIFTLGKGSYINGMDIYCWDETIKISIGKYCAIADKVTVIAGGEHDKDWVSSYQFIDIWQIKELYNKKKKRYKGHITIGNDVWIGNNAIILSGVSIGNGSVVAAGSVVTKDIQPYQIVGGNPAKRIKDRFSQEQIEQLEKICWWNWQEAKIQESVPYFNDVNLFIATHRV